MASNMVDLSGQDDDQDDSLIVINEMDTQPNLPDELIIDADKRPLLEKYVEKINEQYSVEVTFGLSATDLVKQKQWVIVSGETDDRRSAKDYIKALCSPVEILPVSFPPELHGELSKPSIHAKLERQSRTAILFPERGEAEIMGTDNLAVTLAMSAMEDLIAKLESERLVSPAVSPQAGQAASRLDTELRRLTSQDEDLVYDDDYTAMPNAVKRTILGWYIEESPKVAKSGLRPAALEELPKSAKKAMQQNSSESSAQAPAATSTGAAASSNGANNSRGQELLDLGISMGYSQSEVTAVLKRHGFKMKDSEFLQAIVSLRSPAAGSSSSTASVMATPDRQISHPIERIIETHSPGLIGRQAQQESGSTRQVNGAPQEKLFVNYLEQLSRDFEEEEDTPDLDAYKLRNAERLRLLKEAFDKEKEREAASGSASGPEVIDITDDASDTEEPFTTYTARKNRGSSKSNENSAAAANSGGRKSKNKHRQSPTGQKAKRGPSPKNRVQSPQRSNKAQHSPIRVPQGSRGDTHRPSIYTQNAPPHRQNTLVFSPHTSPHRGAQGSDSQQGGKRYIVIDGSNVAMHHSNHKFFSCRGLEICINHFLKLGHTEITAFVPQWRSRSATNTGYPIRDQHLLEDLKQKGFLVYTPARRVPGKNIVCYDDKFVIRLAEETDGIIVSNDNYRDIWMEKREWRHIIETRLLMYSFVGDIMMLPDDPLGRDGPTLEVFLHKVDREVEERLRRQRNPQEQQNQAQHRETTRWNPIPCRQQQQTWQQTHMMQNWQAPAQPQAQQQQQQRWGNPHWPVQQQPPAQPYQQNVAAPNAWQPHHQNQQQQRGQFPQRQHHNSHPQGLPYPQNRQQHNSAPQRFQQPPMQAQRPAGRTNSVTDSLHKDLMSVFPDNLDMVNRVLQNHPTETNLNQLSSLVLEALD